MGSAGVNKTASNSAGGGNAASGSGVGGGCKPCVDPKCQYKPGPNNHRCPGCDGRMHAFCGLGVGSEGYGQKHICERCAGSGVSNAVSVD